MYTSTHSIQSSVFLQISFQYLPNQCVQPLTISSKGRRPGPVQGWQRREGKRCTSVRRHPPEPVWRQLKPNLCPGDPQGDAGDPGEHGGKGQKGEAGAPGAAGLRVSLPRSLRFADAPLSSTHRVHLYARGPLCLVICYAWLMISCYFFLRRPWRVPRDNEGPRAQEWVHFLSQPIHFFFFFSVADNCEHLNFFGGGAYTDLNPFLLRETPGSEGHLEKRFEINRRPLPLNWPM